MMTKNVEKFHELVPTLSHEGHLKLSNGGVLDFDDTRLFRIHLGGDQLTVAHARGAQTL